MTLAELAALDWGSWKSPDEAAGLLTLKDLFDLVESTRGSGRSVELAVETKHPSRHGGQVEQVLVELLTEREWIGADAPVRAMSFSLLALRRMRRLAPELPIVYLMDRVPPPLRDGTLPTGARIAGIGVNVLRDRPEFVRRVHAAGHAVHVWTVDDPADVQLCLDLDVEAIITNRPRTVLEQLHG